MGELEQELEKTQISLHKTEEKKRRLLIGENQEELTIEKLGELKTFFSEQLEGKSLRRILDVVDLSSLIISFSETLKNVKVLCEERTEDVESLWRKNNILHIRLESFDQKIAPLVPLLRQATELEIITLQKINKYLDNWL